MDARVRSPWSRLLRVPTGPAASRWPRSCTVRTPDGGFVARGDLWLVGSRMLHEYDGGVHRERRTHREDLARDRRLLEAGWHRRGYVAEDLLHRPDAILREVDQTLGRRHRVDRLDPWLDLLRESLFRSPRGPAHLARVARRAARGPSATCRLARQPDAHELARRCTASVALPRRPRATADVERGPPRRTPPAALDRAPGRARKWPIPAGPGGRNRGRGAARRLTCGDRLRTRPTEVASRVGCGGLGGAPRLSDVDRRIFGIENEYGVTCTFRGQRRLSPDEVARYLFRKVVSWGRSSNVFLRNGARLYLDVGSHPEYATPECDDIIDLVAHDKAGERVLEGLLVDAERRLHDEGIAGDVYLFKNNTDSAGNSYGCHENYLVSRHGEFSKLADVLIPFLVTRQIIVRRRQGDPDPARGDVLRVPARRAHLGGRLQRHHPVAARSSTPATSRTPTPSATAGCTSSSATRT